VRWGIHCFEKFADEQSIILYQVSDQLQWHATDDHAGA